MKDKQKDNRKKALEELLARLEAGTIHQSDLDAFIPSFGLNTTCGNAHDAMRGSLDAAKALHEAVFPGRSWEIWRVDNDEQVPFYGVNIPNVDTPYSATPARAWLIAILKALIAKATP